jgi:hypothetical protein
MSRLNTELLQQYPCHIHCIVKKDISDARLIKSEGLVEGLNMHGQVIWSKEVKCNETFDIAPETSQVSVHYKWKWNEELEEGIGNFVAPHLVNVKWRKSHFSNTQWKKIDCHPCQLYDEDYQYRPECLAGHHTGTKLRSFRKLPDGTFVGLCTQCIIGRKGYELVTSNDMVADVIILF